jgi:hypothetical protein
VPEHKSQTGSSFASEPPCSRIEAFFHHQSITPLIQSKV